MSLNGGPEYRHNATSESATQYKVTTNFACLLTLNLRCYQFERSFKLLVAKASVGRLEIYTIGMLRECRTRRCTRVVGHGQPSSQHCHVQEV